MMFNHKIKDIVDKPQITPPSKWHIFYYLKWIFVVRPLLIKKMGEAQAKALDEILTSDILRKRIDK